MRQMTWIRWGLASVLITSLGAMVIAVGCGGDDTNPVNPGKDSGTDSLPNGGGTGGGHGGGTGGGTAGGTGGGGGGDSGTANPKAIFLHASPDLPIFRFCFGVVLNGN